MKLIVGLRTSFYLLLIIIPITSALFYFSSQSFSSTSFQEIHQDSTFKKPNASCATVEGMGHEFDGGFEEESLRVRKLIQTHFHSNGAPAVRKLPSERFCRHGFVLGKASEAGFGNEMHKILTAASLSIMLNRSLIIGQNRGKYAFGDYIGYSNLTFTLEEVKSLWKQNGCVKKYGRHLIMRIDDFNMAARTNVLCSNWRKWEQPIVWFKGTTDAMAAQFFLKNIHLEMRFAASELFGDTRFLRARSNVFGELMRVLLSPSDGVEEAVNWVLGGKNDPDISLHMRMLMKRSTSSIQAALNCLRKAVNNLPKSKPRVVLVSDTPSLIKGIRPNIQEFAQVLHFDYKLFSGNLSRDVNILPSNRRMKDWGPDPRWVAIVDFFLASRAKHAVISGAHTRVGTTYAQLIAALAAANNLGDDSTRSSFSFLSSFQRNLLRKGLKSQGGWGHAWNRYAGPLSCRNQSNQCAFTPLLPPGWWDGTWQSPITRDVQKMSAYGIKLSVSGQVDEASVLSLCTSKNETLDTITLF